MSVEKKRTQDIQFFSQNGLQSEQSTSVSVDIPNQESARPVSERTRQLYISYVMTLHRRFRELHPQSHIRDANPLDLVELLLAQASSLRPRTFNSYKVGLLYWLSTFPPHRITEQAVLKLKAECPRDGYKGHKPGTTATKYSERSIRSRTFSRKNFDRLNLELIDRSSRVKDLRSSRRPGELLLWLQAGLASGLRPAEWEMAQWQDIQKGELLVQTAKAKLAYTLPSIRHLAPPKDKTRIVHIDQDAISLVNEHMLSVRRHLDTGAPFEKYYFNNRSYLYQTCIEIFGSTGVRFTLYVMRGQFAANKKKGGFSCEAVGEQMGCSPHVASVNYGNKSAGHRGKGMVERVSPLPKQNESDK